MIYLLLVLLSSQTFAVETKLTADQILKEVDKRVQAKDEVAQIKMVIFDTDGTEKQRGIEIMRQSDNDKQAVRIKLQSPPDLRGTALLSVSENEKMDQWLYLPSSKQTRRILNSSRGSNFLDSELNYEDLGTTTDAGLENKIIKSEADQVVIESKQNRADSPYGKLNTYITMKNYLVSKVEYFDKANKLVKTLEMLDYKSFPGDVWRAQKIVVKNAVNGRGTRLELLSGKINQGVAAKNFSPSSLAN